MCTKPPVPARLVLFGEVEYSKILQLWNGIIHLRILPDGTKIPKNPTPLDKSWFELTLIVLKMNNKEYILSVFPFLIKSSKKIF